jgi:hypothetical protein
MTISRNWRAVFAFLLFGGSAAMAPAQYGTGYGPAYHAQSDAADYAAHWGYRDGFTDGSHDRATGHSFRPTHDGAYKLAPEYGQSPLGRDEYKTIYREAYVRGYEKGYRR